MGPTAEGAVGAARARARLPACQEMANGAKSMPARAARPPPTSPSLSPHA